MVKAERMVDQQYGVMAAFGDFKFTWFINKKFKKII